MSVVFYSGALMVAVTGSYPVTATAVAPGPPAGLETKCEVPPNEVRLFLLLFQL